MSNEIYILVVQPNFVIRGKKAVSKHKSSLTKTGFLALPFIYYITITILVPYIESYSLLYIIIISR